MTLLTLSVVVAQVYLQLRLNIWSGDFFNALDAKNWAVIERQALIFAFLATGLVASAAYQMWLKMAVQGEWRRHLTRTLIDRWLRDGVHYKLGFQGTVNDNPDHRVADDVNLVVVGAVDFAVGILGSALVLVGLLAILWSLSRTASLGFGGVTLTVPGDLVVVALAYAGIGTAATHLLGRPLMRINAERHAREGDFRFGLVRVRENAETIALARSEAEERRGLDASMTRLLEAWKRLMSGVFRLTWATSFYTVAAPVVPLLVSTPHYLAGTLNLGELMQASWAFVQIQLALGWFVDNYARIADWRAGLFRIVELDDAIDRAAQDAPADAPQIHIVSDDQPTLRLEHLRVANPDGSVVLAGITMEVRPGENVLIIGESGVGKSTLIRAIAGLWRWGSGTIRKPAGVKMMFVPHRPVLPLGSLRAAMASPEPLDAFGDVALAVALRRCGLEALVPRLDEVAPWEDLLSGAERQRIAFARLLVHRPDWVFLDEATAQLTEAEQAEMMALLHDELAEAAVIGVDHRSDQPRFYDRTLLLLRREGGAELVAAG